MAGLLRDDRVLRVLVKARRPMRVEEIAKRLRLRRRVTPEVRLRMAEASCRRLVRDGLAWETADGRFTTDSRRAAGTKVRTA